MTLLSVSELRTAYDGVRAVDGVSLSLARGETVGLVGESGCGKSSLAKSILRLVEPQGGGIVFDGTDVRRLRGAGLRRFRRRAQMVFQDPYASLNPRHSVAALLETPLKVHGLGGRDERRARVARVLDRVGLPQAALPRYPHEFSGGQRQRIGIARALVLEPQLVVCDEPVSALDLSIQAQILNLLAAMRRELGLAYLFVSHDLSVVNHVADRVLVMYLGRIVESAPTEALWAAPRHPYTRALIEAVPDRARRRRAPPLAGDLPSPGGLPAGCRFHPRCPLASERCRREDPALRPLGPAHAVACHHAA
ncbi:Oligopeptide transport ATP-binding protein OppF [Methylobacterium crusticola]|uniref:Oligopeptide transport ATP-binding protein OppF n=1 Tax=Methylobacterium crusticola TaxID=1697972 RepID=A0ABQ4QTQ8_9HYPH|nr:oligopeptide/dipeptide ABC transporter ATP-binding protein [Methylobacterium crusticola]GJD48339.1 Oligopeptide transport ATP-binding protein OppF [Methylobacterium crusticola]